VDTSDTRRGRRGGSLRRRHAVPIRAHRVPLAGDGLDLPTAERRCDRAARRDSDGDEDPRARGSHANARLRKPASRALAQSSRLMWC